MYNSSVKSTRDYWRTVKAKKLWGIVLEGGNHYCLPWATLSGYVYYFSIYVRAEESFDVSAKRLAIFLSRPPREHREWAKMCSIAREHIKNNTWPDTIFWERQIELYKELWRKQLIAGSNRHRGKWIS